MLDILNNVFFGKHAAEPRFLRRLQNFRKCDMRLWSPSELVDREFFHKSDTLSIKSVSVVWTTVPKRLSVSSSFFDCIRGNTVPGCKWPTNSLKNINFEISIFAQLHPDRKLVGTVYLSRFLKAEMIPASKGGILDVCSEKLRISWRCQVNI